jgi:hypothetical protein
MGWFIVVVGLVGASALATNAALNVLARLGRFALALGVFLVSSVGAVAAGFLLYMMTLAWAGELPPRNIVWPCLTWALISISALVAGSGRPVQFAFRATPWLLVGGFTMLSSTEHPRNMAAAVAIVLVGLAYGARAGQAAPCVAGASEDSAQKLRRGVAPTIGPYHLDMKTTALLRLSELTPNERAALGASIQFKNERIYHAPPGTFAGASWEIILGAVDDQVYKVSALLTWATQGPRDAQWRNVDAQLRPSLGSPANASTTIMTWDTDDGNVVMNRAEGGGAYVLVLTLTSRAVSGFVRVK